MGFGLAPGELDELSAAGLSTTVARWMDPGANGVAAAPDPWAGVELSVIRPHGRRAGVEQRALIGSWLQAMMSTPRPFEEWMRWFWHGHFVSTLQVVGRGALLRNQLQMFGQLGLGDFPTLLRAVTVDPAMLLYLNGDTNAINKINENYGREVLELFALGIGNYTEDDVRAGATALTGYQVDLDTGVARYRPIRHDDTPQTYLGRSGVHDVDSVVDAIVNHPACGPFIAGELARAVLGPGISSGLVTSLAKGFVSSGLQLRPLMQAIVEAGLEGQSTPLVLAPVPWAMATMRATGASYDSMAMTLLRDLKGAGQLPFAAPNVGGWPGGVNWLSASATLARYDLAASAALAAASSSPVVGAAATGDWQTLADSLGHPQGFATPTRSALSSVGHTSDADRNRLALALASPDLVVA